MPDSDPNPSGPPSRPHYAWPKFVLAAVALFFTVCILWTAKVVLELKRAKADGQDMRPRPESTNQ